MTRLKIMLVRRQIKKILRRAIKPALSKIRNVLDETEIDPVPPDFSKDDTAYRWLNWLLDTSVREAHGRLRPNYTWALLHAGHLAKTLGIRRISAIEFGVAGGNGLLALENAAVSNPINSYTEKETFADFAWDGRPAVDVHIRAECPFVPCCKFSLRHGGGRRGRSLVARGARICAAPRASRVRWRAIH